MLDIGLWATILLMSLYALVKASDYFTNAAEKIGLMLGLSQFVIGATIVSMGTSLPELISSIIAVLENSSEIVIGNVIGSNVANIFLVLGVGAIIGKKLNISFNLLNVDLPLLLGSAFFLAAAAYDGSFSRGEALLFLAGLLVFIFYIINDGPRHKSEKGSQISKRAVFQAKPFIILVINAVVIYFSATYTVEAVIKLSEILGIGKEIVAVSVVALGTSLPELAVTISAVKRKQAELVIGNVLGSNIFNTFAVMGIPGIISSLVIPQTLIEVGLPALVFSTLLFFGVTLDKRVTRWEGWMFLIFYGYFIGKLFHLL